MPKTKLSLTEQAEFQAMADKLAEQAPAGMHVIVILGRKSDGETATASTVGEAQTINVLRDILTDFMDSARKRSML